MAMNRIDRADAERLFHEADELYREQRYAESLSILDQLNAMFPNKHRVLFPRARCLAKLGHFQEALDVCQTLVVEHDYSKAQPLLDKLIEHQRAPSTIELEPYLASSGFETPPPTDGRAFDSKIDLKSPPPIGISAIEKKKQRRMTLKIKPIRLMLLIFIGVAIWQGWMVWWLGAGLITAYFVIRIMIGRFLTRLLITPFKMKGAALRNATAQVHAVNRCKAPERKPDEDDDEDKDSKVWYAIDVTITPSANIEGPFRLWEPGELALAPAGIKLKSADDIDATIPVADCRYVNPEASASSEAAPDGEDEGPKVHGPLRVVLTVGVPQDLRRAQFAYYFETFGDFAIR